MSQVFTLKHNARRAARQALGRAAKEGGEFTLRQVEGGWSWARVEAAKAARSDTKQSQAIAMIRRPDGASIAELAAAFEWQPHTTRGFIAGALKKKLGLAVTSSKVEGRGTVYRLADAPRPAAEVDEALAALAGVGAVVRA